ncbi:hypothetical protein [Micromonospora sp. WMMD812]|uniref:hypothetical protein n=1 Tax=Micromonospora sp. WMMD812 TaxID=3015152 RepID=UPI00248AAF2E|nr:hypothetical protein [Micromonospora sp. WMMD812]WBB69377.1 hypothetical protein O7603_08515 [Micromonospora sp. WMMD812]
MAIRRSVMAVVAAGLLLAAGCDAPADNGPRPTGTPGARTPATIPGGSTPARVAGGDPPATVPAGRSLLRIITQLGEQCPPAPVSPNPRCDPKPRPGTGFEIRATGRDFVARGSSGPDGRLTVPVDPGTYLVRGEPVPGYRFTPERQVTVDRNAAADVPLTYTNGIH